MYAMTLNVYIFSHMVMHTPWHTHSLWHGSKWREWRVLQSSILGAQAASDRAPDALEVCYLCAMSANPLQPLPSLTTRQADVLLFVGQYFAVHRQPPTHTELRRHLQLGERTNVTPYLMQLISRGYLEKAGPEVRGRMLLTRSGIDRMAVLLADKARGGEYRELRRLIADVQSTKWPKENHEDVMH